MGGGALAVGGPSHISAFRFPKPLLSLPICLSPKHFLTLAQHPIPPPHIHGTRSRLPRVKLKLKTLFLSSQADPRSKLKSAIKAAIRSCTATAPLEAFVSPTTPPELSKHLLARLVPLLQVWCGLFAEGWGEVPIAVADGIWPVLHLFATSPPLPSLLHMHRMPQRRASSL